MYPLFPLGQRSTVASWQKEAGLSNRKRLAQTPSKSRLELRIEPGSLLVCPGLAVAESLLPHAQSALELPLE